MDSTNPFPVLPAGASASIGAMDALAGGRASALQRAARTSPAEAAQRFEEMLGSMLVKEMRQALPEGFFGKSAGSDVYGGWLDEHLGRALAENGGLGLRDALLPALGAGAAAAEAAEGPR